MLLHYLHLVGPAAPWCCHGGCGHRNAPWWQNCTACRWRPASHCGALSQQWCSWQRAGIQLVRELWCTPGAGRKPHLLLIPSMQQCEADQRTLDLLQALSSFSQGFFQPFKLSSRVCHVTWLLIGTIVEDSVETNDPQTRFNQLGVEATCSDAHRNTEWAKSAAAIFGLS